MVDKSLLALAYLIGVLYKLGSIASNGSYLANVLNLTDGGSLGVAVSIEFLNYLTELCEGAY